MTDPHLFCPIHYHVHRQLHLCNCSCELSLYYDGDIIKNPLLLSGLNSLCTSKFHRNGDSTPFLRTASCHLGSEFSTHSVSMGLIYLIQVSSNHRSLQTVIIVSKEMLSKASSTNIMLKVDRLLANYERELMNYTTQE